MAYNAIKPTPKKVFEKIEARGIIRIDYIIDNGEVYLNEINAVPGSLSYYLLTSSPEEFTALLTALINSALKEYAKKSSRIKTFPKSIFDINIYAGNKGAKAK